MIIPYHCPECGKDIRGTLTVSDKEATCGACGAVSKIPPTGPAPGVVLGNGFRIERKLRSSSIGEVYLAYQESMSRQVMIKLLPASARTDDEAVGRFQREVKLTAGLHHPNLLSAIDAGEDCEILYMVTPYREGQTLEEIFQEQGTLEVADALKALLPVARALKFAWDEKKLIHRNFKPSAVIVPKDGESLLTDLGIAKSTIDSQNTLTGAGFVVGTPTYMSPEQCRGVFRLDYHTDMYAFACVLFELVAGKPPFMDDNPMVVMQNHLKTPAPDLRGVLPSAPPEMAKLIQKMMAKEREDRPADWGEVIAELEALARAARRSAAAPPSPPKKRLTAPPAPVISPVAQQKASSTAVLMYVVMLLMAIAVLLAAAYYAMNPNKLGTEPGTELVAEGEPTDPNAPVVTSLYGDEPLTPTSEEGDATPDDGTAAPVDPFADTGDLQADFELAVTWLDTHPGDFQPAIDRLARMRTRARDAGNEAMAEEADTIIGKLVAERRDGVDATIKELRAQAAAALAAGKRAEAEALLTDYTGDFERETKAARLAMAQNLDALAAAGTTTGTTPGTTAAEPVEPEPTVDPRLAAMRGRVISLILNGNAAAATEIVTQMAEDKTYADWRTELAELNGIAAAVAGVDAYLIDSLRAEIGKEVVLKLKTRSDLLRIRKVEGNVIEAQQPVDTGETKGWIGLKFTIADLHPDERAKRLRHMDSPYLPYVMVVEAHARKDRPAAVRMLEAINTPTAAEFAKSL